MAEEHDTVAFARLGAAIRAVGGTLEKSTWGIGGSQEISEWTVACPGGILGVTVETYCGLRVAGSKQLVTQLREHYRDSPAR